MLKIVVVSDTHTQHEKLAIPECDILIHCGDFTYQGKYWEVRPFVSWLRKQPARHKLILAGNHEQTFDRTHEQYNPGVKALLADPFDKSIHYLENSAITIDRIKFYGTPWTPWFYDWGFNGITDKDLPFARNGSRGLTEVYSEIPEDVNVLICHGPPYDILDMSLTGDERTGSVEMRKLTSEKLTQLRLYLCGHIHEARGAMVADGGIQFVNASTLDRSYEVVRPPIIIDLDENGFTNSIEGLE